VLEKSIFIVFPPSFQILLRKSRCKRVRDPQTSAHMLSSSFSKEYEVWKAANDRNIIDQLILLPEKDARKTGMLQKRSRVMRQFKDRWFTLWDHYMLFYKFTMQNEKKLSGVISIYKCTVIFAIFNASLLRLYCMSSITTLLAHRFEYLMIILKASLRLWKQQECHIFCRRPRHLMRNPGYRSHLTQTPTPDSRLQTPDSRLRLRL
jgi:hypothetical protein